MLYLGDHVFSDLSKPSRIGWRTGAIIHELEREVALQTSGPYRRLLAELQTAEHALRTSEPGTPFARVAQLREEREVLREKLKGATPRGEEGGGGG